MTDTSTIDTRKPSVTDRAPSASPSGRSTKALVQPLDLVAALTGLALLFFSLFVYAVAEWRYLGTDVDHVTPLGWIAPLVAGGLCLLATAITVASRAASNARAR